MGTIKPFLSLYIHSRTREQLLVTSFVLQRAVSTSLAVSSDVLYICTILVERECLLIISNCWVAYMATYVLLPLVEDIYLLFKLTD